MLQSKLDLFGAASRLVKVGLANPIDPTSPLFFG
jgi:hypothetical protein